MHFLYKEIEKVQWNAVLLLDLYTKCIVCLGQMTAIIHMSSIETYFDVHQM